MYLLISNQKNPIVLAEDLDTLMEHFKDFHQRAWFFIDPITDEEYEEGFRAGVDLELHYEHRPDFFNDEVFHISVTYTSLGRISQTELTGLHTEEYGYLKPHDTIIKVPVLKI